MGDHVLLVATPNCGKCIFCRSPKTNLCTAETFDMKSMPDNTLRQRLVKDGVELYNFLSLGSLIEFLVVSQIHVAKINPIAPLEKVCVISCGIATGHGGAVQVSKVEAGSSVAIFGLGTTGLATATGARACGAAMIIGVDLIQSKLDQSKTFGVTDTINPRDLTDGKTVGDAIRELTNGFGADYTFECAGIESVAEQAINAAAPGWGAALIQGAVSEVRPIGKKM